MLFPYKYVSHQMEKMQEFIDFIFHDVWCKAPSSGPFRLELFDGNADLKGVMTLFQVGDTQAGDFFYGHVDRIYGHFAALSHAQIDQLKLWYEANNNIEKACVNDPALQLARYTDITTVNAALCKELAIFFKGLYSQDLLGAAALRAQIGEIDDHYKRFMQENRVGKCPFCGINDIKGIHHTKREAYDHYLPKGLYPFNSINFRNLAPTCHECNSSYKLTKDPVNSAAGRRRAFYPFAKTDYSIEVKIDLSKPDIDDLALSEIQLKFGPEALGEEIETWKDVYGIEERYKAKCCSGDAKDWLEQVRILKDAHGLEPSVALGVFRQQAHSDPFANANFLRKSFLEGCDRIGILNGFSGEASGILS